MRNDSKRLLFIAGLLAAVFSLVPAVAQTTGGGSSGGSSGSGKTTTGSTNNSGSSGNDSDPTCHGKSFNPYNDMDWNLLYPITVAGVPMGGGYNPPLMYEPPVCVCPGIFGIPSYGVGLTYWEPLYVAEIQRMPGCLSTTGGSQTLDEYKSLHGEHEGGSDGGQQGTTTRMQAHWYEYPVFGMLDLMKDAACKNNSGFALRYMTETDSTWQDDSWGVMYTPEAVLFANLVSQTACAVDAVSSNLGYTADPLFWCAGGWGPIYPLTGNSQPGNGPWLTNGQILSKLMSRLHHLGMLWETIGPAAQCFSYPNPIMLKSQYRINQIGPVPRRGTTPEPVIGSQGANLLPQPANYPGFESTDYMIWQGQQCCARIY